MLQSGVFLPREVGRRSSKGAPGVNYCTFCMGMKARWIDRNVHTKRSWAALFSLTYFSLQCCKCVSCGAGCSGATVLACSDRGEVPNTFWAGQTIEPLWGTALWNISMTLEVKVTSKRWQAGPWHEAQPCLKTLQKDVTKCFSGLA